MRSFKDALKVAQKRALAQVEKTATIPFVKRAPKVSDLAQLTNVQDVSVRYKGRAAERVAELFGRAIPDDQLAAALGALAGATVEVGMNSESDIVAAIIHPHIDSQARTISKDAGGKIYRLPS